VKGLDTLIKLHRRRLDDQRRHMADLERQRDALKAQVAALEDSLVRESQLVDHEGDVAQAFPTFLSAALARRRHLERAIVEAEAAIAEAHEELGALFQETKRFEVAAERRSLRARSEEERRAQIRLDEIGLVQHRLNQSRAKA
jgi:flagellar export protein FliJ